MEISVTYATLISAFMAGLLGSTHCIGMCGGIVGALGWQSGGQQRPTWGLLLGYNIGRISSYAIAGALVASIGGAVLDQLQHQQAMLISHVIAGLFMVLLGLYIGGWWPALTWFERAGGYVWKYIEPIGRRFIPARHAGQALGVGLVWGWLPCGLVYSILPWTLGTGSALNGAIVMLTFGLGTLPMLLMLGRWAAAIRRVVANAIVRQIAGAALLGWGLYFLANTIFGGGGAHH